MKYRRGKLELRRPVVLGQKVSVRAWAWNIGHQLTPAGRRRRGARWLAP